MKFPVKRAKSLSGLLKDLKPSVCNGEPLYTGKPQRVFDGLRPREIFGNWLICVVENYRDPGGDYTVSSAPNGGDGVICNRTTENGYLTEHIMVHKKINNRSSTEDLILEAIENKKSRGGSVCFW